MTDLYVSPGSATQTYGQLAELVTRLSCLYDEYATCWAAERQARADALQMAQESSLGKQENWATIRSTPFALETVRINYEIKAAELQYDHLKFVISHQKVIEQ